MVAARKTTARRLKVAYYVGIYHRFTGSQRSLWLLVRDLPRERIDPLCIFAGEGYATRMFRELPVDVKVVGPGAPLQRFGKALLRAGWIERVLLATTALAPYTLRLARVLRRENVDILHCNDPRGLLLAAPAARLIGIPVVFHVRGDQTVLGPFYINTCALLSDRMVFVSNGIRRSIPSRYRSKFRTVYNGIDPPSAPPRRSREELLASLSPPLATRAGDVFYVAVGSLVAFKGIHHLIHAVARARDRRIKLILVGDRPDESYGRYLDGLVARYGLDDVRFVGWDSEAGDWFAAADVVCLPTIEREELQIDGERRLVTQSEGFSRSILEAMAHGRPVIATHVAGAPEQIVDGVTGILVPPSDPQALASALLRMLADLGLRQRMGLAGAARVRAEFSMARYVADTTDIYRELAPRSIIH